MKYIFSIFIFLISIVICFAYGYGVFTDFYFNARTIGVGENEYISHDPLLNSAFLIMQNKKSFSFSSSIGYMGEYIGYVSYFNNIIKRLVFGISVDYLNKDLITKYDENGDSIGEFIYNEVQPNLLFALSMNDYIGIGYSFSVQLGNIDEERYSYPTHSISIILGSEDIILGASINNKGIDVSDDYGSISSAMRWSLGTSGKISGFKGGIIGGGLYKEYTFVSIGMEYLLKNIFPLRIGYKIFGWEITENQPFNNGLTLGFGIIEERINIDYAIQFKRYLGMIHTINIQFILPGHDK